MAGARRLSITHAHASASSVLTAALGVCLVLGRAVGRMVERRGEPAPRAAPTLVPESRLSPLAELDAGSAPESSSTPP